jgi:hypothetical protein
MPRIVPEIYSTFPNMTELDIHFSGLLEIDPIPSTVQLEYFIAYGNNLTTIANGTFATQSETLWYLQLIRNQLTSLEQDAFQGLGEVLIIFLLFNDIETPPPRVFFPLTKLVAIDFEGNRFRRIHHAHFLQNNDVSMIFMENNAINEISPQFAFGLRNNLDILFQYENLCIDRAFVDINTDDIVKAFMFNSQQRCFNNWLQNENRTRTLSLDFQGPLKVLDDFGNLLITN